ncbi:SMI1/KNR4 family protein [Nocardia sp. NPDC048505]|uniref:SMI1/KNR4 family protein n=1 Tax=unclassified Nocardia TaxID=2637762 RepID=UPI0033FF6603
MTLGTFDHEWDRLLTLLSYYSPAARAALRPPAASAEIDRLETEFGCPLHPELRALLRRNNGAANTRYGDRLERTGAFLPGGYQLIDADGIIAAHHSSVDIMRRVLTPELWQEDELYGHMHQWATIAHSVAGGALIIDHRPGPAYGHVYEIGIGSGTTEGTLWGTSLAAFVRRVANALNTRSAFRDEWPTVRESELSGQILLAWER